MNTIDSRVVEAKFDNRQFQEGVKGTLNSLDALKKGLKLDGATKGLNDIDAASKRLTLTHISDAVDRIASKFSAFGILAVSSLVAIATQAAQTGLALIKSFSFGPISSGLSEYETNLNSIQTILSNTQWQGATLDQVNGALQELNTYSDKTIYNFSEMARNIGTFTAAGVKLDVSVNAIKGISNLAAISGSSADQASTAMYQLSQALSTGTVKLMDWNSVVNAGMGGKVFQDALKETARAHGVAVDSIIKKEGSFRDSLQTGWLSADILTETLSKFTGDLSRAQLKQMGYTDKQIDGIIKMGKTAQDAATKIKTMHQLIDTLQESLGSGWSQTFQLIFGNFDEAKTLWSGAYNVLNGMISTSANMRNKVLADWKKLGGRTVLIDTIADAFHNVMDVVHAVEGAFREVFPRQTGQTLYNLTVGLHDFVDSLKIGGETLNNLKRTLAGFFAVLDIGWQIVKAGIHFIADLFGMITKGEGSGGFLGMTANIGDFLVALDKAIKKGEGLTKFFHGLEHVLAVPIAMVKSLADALFDLFDFKAPSADNITKSFEPLGTLGHVMITVWDKVIGVLDNVFHSFSQIADGFRRFFGGFADVIQSAFGDINYEDVLHTINTGLFAGLVLLVKKMVGIFKGGANAPQGFVDSLMSPFHQMTDTLKSMQNTLRATTLLEIAAAIGIMTASVIGLSHVDAAGLTRALTAMTFMFGQLFTSMIVFNKIGGAQGLTATATGLILFATAIRILTSSVKALSQLSWTELAKGLIGVTVLIGGLTLAVRGMSGQTGGMIRAGAGLMLLAVGIKLLASAVTDLSGLSWEDMSKGLVGVGSLLLALTLFTRFADANKGGVMQGAGLVLLGAAIKILASAVQDFAATSWEGIGKGLTAISAVLLAVAVFSKTVGNPISLMASGAALIMIATAMDILAAATGKFAALNWNEIAKGLVSMGVALGIMAAALNAMPPISSLPSSVALVAVGAALLLIAEAVTKMSGMSWEEIGKGITVLASSLALIAVAMDAMLTALPGAAALLVVSGALAILTPVLLTLGKMSWSEIVRGLTTLAGAFVILGVAGALLTPVIPSLIGLGAAITLLGVGVALVGAGVLALSVGLTAIAAAGGAATVVIVAMVSAILGILPVVVKEIGLLVVALAEAVAAAAPAIAKAVTAVMLGFLKVVRDTSPQIIRTFGQLLVDLLAELAKDTPKMADSAFKMFLGILKALEKNEPQIIAEMIVLLVGLLNAIAGKMDDITAAGANVIIKFLEGIAKKLPGIISAGTDVIIAFIKGVGSNAVRIANAAMDTIVDFINGLADAINSHVDDFRDAGLHMAEAIINGLTFGLESKVKGVVKGAIGLGKSAVKGIGGFLGIHSPSTVFQQIGEYVVEGFIRGLTGNREQINNAWDRTNNLISFAMRRAEEDVTRAQQKLFKLTNAREQDTVAIRRARFELALARTEYNRLSDTMDVMHGRLAKEKDALTLLTFAYDSYDKRLTRARNNLREVIKSKDDFFDSVKSQYSDLPDISQDTTLEDYINQLTYKVEDNKKFTETLLKLKLAGLNDTMYKELLAQGADALPFAEQILAGGKEAIQQINSLDAQLTKSATMLQYSTAIPLKLAAIAAAQGIIDGLKKQRAYIQQVMENIADDIVQTIKNRLQIRSPSEVMKEIGGHITMGLAVGMSNASPMFESMSASFIERALNAMKQAISRIRELLSYEMDLNPKIAPVLDLTTFRKDLSYLESLWSAVPLSADSAYSTAKNVSSLNLAGRGSELAELLSILANSAPGNISFTQYNTSPKALSSAEIYRQTKNQLSVVKGALTSNVA